MHWNSKFALKSREGETREVKKFLFFPKHFIEDTKWHWLETVIMEERICKVNIGGSMEWENFAWKWCEIGIKSCGINKNV